MIETKFTIKSLAEAISGKIVGADDFRSPKGFNGIFNVLNDSTEGDIVIRHWIDEKGIKIASTKNVACIITEDPRGNSIEIATELKIPIIVVEKIEEANAVALNWALKNFAPNSKRVVITGTNGKSTTSHMIYHILKTTGANTLTNTDSKSEFNTLIDPMVPKLISEYALANEESLEYVVIEVSEVQGWLGKLMNNHAYLMTKAVDPDVAVVTNVAIDHIGLVNSIEEVFRETSGVAKAIRKGTLVLNSDDKKVLAMADFADKNVDLFYFSMEDNSALKNNKNEIIANLNEDNNLIYDNKKAIIYNSKTLLTFDEFPFKSDHFIQNTLAAISACLSLGINIKDIINGVKSYKSLKRRFRIINDNPTVVDDFAHNPEGIKATLNAVSNLSNGNLNVLYAIRGSRGKEINKMNAEALAEIINFLNNRNFSKNSNDTLVSVEDNSKDSLVSVEDNSKDSLVSVEDKSNGEFQVKTNIELVLSSSADVVDEANFVEEFEEEITFRVLNRENIEYTHHKKLHDALVDIYSSAGLDDAILLIGAQGMDPAEMLLEDIIEKMDE